MRNSKRLLAGALAAMTMFTSIPVSALDLSVPTTLNASQVTYNTNYNIVIQAQAYKDDSFTDLADTGLGTEVSPFTQIVQKTYTCHSGEDAKANFDIDISDIMSQIDAYKANGSYKLGTAKIKSSYVNDEDMFAGSGVAVNGSSLSLTNLAGYDDDYNTNSNNYTDYVGNLQVVVTIPFTVTDKSVDPNFKGTYNHGYISNAKLNLRLGVKNTWGQRFSIPTVNVKDNPTKVPLLLIEAGETSATSEVVWLETNYIGTGHLGYKTIDSGVAVDDITFLDDFDTNPNPAFEREYTCDSLDAEVLKKFNDSIQQVGGVGNPNATGDFSHPVVMKAIGSEPVEVEGNTYFTKFNVAIKAIYQVGYHSYDDAINSTGAYWSEVYGMTPCYYFLVQNSSYEKIVDYYNVYDGDKENAELVATIKNDSGVEPSTNKDGWIYLNSDSEVVEQTYELNHIRVNRYYTQTEDKTFSYKLKYKAVYDDGSPAEGISIKNEVTGADGFISGVDTYSVTLKDMLKKADGSYQTVGTVTSDYYTLDPNETDSVISFKANDKDYKVNASWSLSNRPQVISADGKPETVSHHFGLAGRYDDVDINREDDFTSVFVINVGAKLDESKASVPVKINYYLQGDRGVTDRTLITSEDTTIQVPVTKSGDTVVEAPTSYTLNDYSIISGMQAVATSAGVDTDALSLVSCYAGGALKATFTQKQNVDMSAKTLTTTFTTSDGGVGCFEELSNGKWIVNITFKKADAVNITVHYRDKSGNTLHADNTYKFTNDSNDDIYFVEDITDWVPLGQIDGYIPYESGVAIRNEYSKGVGTDGASFYRNSTITSSNSYEITVYYEYDPQVKVYNVINFDYDNATYVGEVSCNPNTSYRLNVGDYSGVALVEPSNGDNSTITVEKLQDSSLKLKGWSTVQGDFANEIDPSSTAIVTGTENMNVYIHYVTPVTIKVVDEFYKADGTTLVTSKTRSTVTEDYGYEYDYKALNYSERGNYPNLVGESRYMGTATSDITITFKYKANSAYIYVYDNFLDKDGNYVDELSGLRSQTEVELGDTYSYLPISKTGYTCLEDYVDATPKSEWSGTVSQSYTYINFYYQADKPVYILTVKDRYLDASGVEEKVDTRNPVSIPENSPYTTNALNPDDYEVVGEKQYSGTMTGNLELTFTYKKKLKDFTLTVKDKYLDENGNEEKTDVRPTQTIKENSSYSVDALNPEGYDVIGDTSKSGVATSDVVIEFVYQKKSFTITVKDKYLDANGNEERVDTRLTETKAYGYRYSYNALSPADYTLLSQASYSGTLTSNKEITFVYQKDKYFNVTVLDEYVSVDGDIQKTDTRLTTSKKMGDSYSYNALTVEGYVVTSESSYSGVVTSDTTVKFVYREDAARFVTVKGYITYTDGTPIANKRIEIHSTPRYAVTDENGYYEIKNVEVGDHKFKIFADDSDTALVTCDLSVTKPNEDTVRVTFKTDDCEVETDTSVMDVLKIDAILPLYKITVKDEYYDGTTLEKSETRLEKTVKSGDTYSFEALNPDGYDVSSAKKYEGVAVSNLELVFKYTKKVTPPTPVPTPEPKYYNVKVIDNYYSSTSALTKSEVRVNDTVVENTPYDYKALSPEGYTVTGNSSYSGVVTKDLVLVFNYKENEKVVEPNKYNLKVVDSYYDVDGNLENSSVREEKVVTEGFSYYYEALSPEKYEVTGAVKYNGQVVSDTVLEFKYKAVKLPTPEPTPDPEPTPEPEPTPTPVPTPDPVVNEYTITVIDKYIVGVKNLYSDSVFGGLTDSEGVTIQKVEGADDYIVSVERVVRCKDTYKEGASYSYNAEAPLGFTTISDKAYSGVVTKDLTLEFVYAKGFDSIEDIPEDIINTNPTPVIPFDEPQTSDSTIPYLPLVLVLPLAMFVVYKKRKRV